MKGRTINLVEAGGVGGIARPTPGPPIRERGGYVNWFSDDLMPRGLVNEARICKLVSNTLMARGKRLVRKKPRPVSN